MSRLPDFNPHELSKTQRTIYDRILIGPRGKFGGPFYALIQAPEIADQVQALVAALRFSTHLDDSIREVAILTAARYWKNRVEWNTHVVIALQAGLSEELVLGIRDHAMSALPNTKERQVYGFCWELLEQKQVSDSTFSETSAILGNEQVVELISVLGYFGLLAMLLNAFEIEPDGIDGLPPEKLQLPDGNIGGC